MKSEGLAEEGMETQTDSRLVDFIQDWVDRHETTWSWLFKEAGLSPSSATGMKKGAKPEARTLFALAQVMEVPASVLFALSGYSEGIKAGEIDLTPDKLALLDEYEALDKKGRALALKLIRAIPGSVED